MEILTITIFVIWVISVIVVGNIYSDKDIEIGFWPMIGISVPIINTIIAIKYGNVSSDFGLKEFIRKLNENV